MIFSKFFALWNLLILLVIACASHLLLIWVFKKSDQVIRLSIQLEYKDNFYLELECGPAQPYLFYGIVQLRLYTKWKMTDKLGLSCAKLNSALLSAQLQLATHHLVAIANKVLLTLQISIETELSCSWKINMRDWVGLLEKWRKKQAQPSWSGTRPSLAKWLADYWLPRVLWLSSMCQVSPEYQGHSDDYQNKHAY